ncbi:MAG: potassium transporter TrkG, partial [Coriobacteriaceae bacterium]|nr:potassium transporter TrkG [Coriobacteriaceae bacterium]
APRVEGMARMAVFILEVTFATELLGAFAMMPTLCLEYGARGVWLAVFLSISAFCNAGFDIMGTPEAPYVSLTAYADNPSIVIAISLLIVLGGIGFFTWDDIVTNRGRFKRYSMQSKVILATTAILIVLPALYFFVFEYGDLPATERTLASLFQSVTTRTAGFNVEDLSTMSEPSQALTIILMLIGGSPGSTAGGVKTTTLAVLIANFISVCFRREETNLFGRRIVDDIVKQASAVFIMYVGLALLGGVTICLIEGLPYLSCLYECASAIGTVGLTCGITPSLGTISRIILMLFMFLGRVGGLTVVYAATKDLRRSFSRLPHEDITIG